MDTPESDIIREAEAIAKEGLRILNKQRSDKFFYFDVAVTINTRDDEFAIRAAFHDFIEIVGQYVEAFEGTITGHWCKVADNDDPLHCLGSVEPKGFTE